MALGNVIHDPKPSLKEAYGKHPGTRVHGSHPFNAGPPARRLAAEILTPMDLFFVRNHGNVPAVDVSSYRLSLHGRVKHALHLSIADLHTLFPRVTMPALLQCAGLRRSELQAVRPIPGEVNWGQEPVGVALWSGVRLRDVLEAAGVDAEAKHVAFTGLDEVERHGERVGFGGSIPLEKAFSDEVLLAYAMNGRPLEPAHGFPLRVVVPGYIGARSVKWLSELTVQAEPSSNYFQTNAYKVFPPDVSAQTADWNATPALEEFPTNSAICDPHDTATVAAGKVRIRGYAFARGDRQVGTVEVLLDDRAPVRAEFLTPSRLWVWRMWQADLVLKPGAHTITVRATDSTGYTQPSDLASLWNFKGYLNNAWHRIIVRAR